MLVQDQKFGVRPKPSNEHIVSLDDFAWLGFWTGSNSVHVDRRRRWGKSRLNNGIYRDDYEPGLMLHMAS